jgi:tetratricopeptide (TPR) repeat protein
MKKWEEYAAEALEAMEEDKYEEGIEYATKSIKAGCKEPQIYYIRGFCNLQSHNFDASIKDLDIVIDKDKKNYLARSLRGMCFINKTDYKKALKDFDFSVKHCKDSNMDYYYRGICHSYMNNYALAIKDLDKALETEMVEDLFYRQRGFCHYCLQHLKEAKEDILHYTTLVNTDAYCFFVLSKIETDQKNYHEAIKYISQAIYLDGDNQGYYIERMKLYLMTDQYDKSKVDQERSMSMGLNTMGVMIGGKFISLSDMGKMHHNDDEDEE